MPYCIKWAWSSSSHGYDVYFHHLPDKMITIFVTFKGKDAIAWTISNYLFAQRDTETIHEILGIIAY